MFWQELAALALYHVTKSTAYKESFFLLSMKSTLLSLWFFPGSPFPLLNMCDITLQWLYSKQSKVILNYRDWNDDGKLYTMYYFSHFWCILYQDQGIKWSLHVFLFFLNNLGLFFLSYPGQFGNHTHTQLDQCAVGAIYVRQQRRDVSVSAGEGNKNIMWPKGRWIMQQVQAKYNSSGAL